MMLLNISSFNVRATASFVCTCCHFLPLFSLFNGCHSVSYYIKEDDKEEIIEVGWFQSATYSPICCLACLSSAHAFSIDRFSTVDAWLKNRMALGSSPPNARFVPSLFAPSFSWSCFVRVRRCSNKQDG